MKISNTLPTDNININENSRGINLRETISVFFKYKLKIILFSITTWSLIVLGVYLWPETYSSSAHVLVKRGRENTSSPVTLTYEQPGSSTGVTREDINSEMEIMKSDYLIRETVKKLGVDFLNPKPVKPDTFFALIKYYCLIYYIMIRDWVFELLYKIDLLVELSPFENTVKDITKKIEVSAIKNSYVLEVGLKWKNPIISSVFTNTLLDLYRDYRIELYQTPKAYNFFKEEAALAKSNLLTSEKQMETFIKDSLIIAPEEQNRLEANQISKLTFDLENIELKKYILQTQIKDILNKLDKIPSEIKLNNEIKVNPLLEAIDNQLLNLEIRKKQLSEKFKESSRTVSNINETIEDLKIKRDTTEKMIDETRLSGVNPIFQKIEERLIINQIELSSLEKEEAVIKDQLNKYLSESRQSIVKNVELTRKKREVDLYDESYRMYVKKFEMARISNAMDSEKIVNISIINKAEPKFIPVRPKKLLTVSLGAIVSVLGGLVLALISYKFDHSIKSKEDIEYYLQTEMLSSIRKY